MLRSLLLAAALVGLAPAAAAQARVHDTGTVRLEVFNTGAVGASVGSGASFTYLGVPTLFDGRLLVGTGPGRLSGAAYSNADWTPGTPLAAATPPTGYTQAFSGSFSDAAAPTPLGVTVEQRSRSGTGAGLSQVVILDYTIRNTTAAALGGVYVGLFADFDVSGFGDLGRRDTPRALIYTYQPGTTNPYVAVALVGTAPLSGWSVTLSGQITDADLFAAMTTPGQVPTAGGDRVSVIGSGPYAIPAGGSVAVSFAFAAGSSLANLRTATTGLVSTAEGDAPAGDVATLDVAPNPASAQTTLAFELDAAQPVRLAVVDVLGREVAVVTDGMRTAGAHTAAVDTAALLSGVYVARLTAGAQTVTRRFTVAH